MRIVVLLTFFVGLVSTLPAAIIFTREAPGVQQTSVAGAINETFDSLSTGPLGMHVSPVGTYSAGAAIASPDMFGGANQTQYIAVGTQSGTNSYELAFPGLRTYFGFYWGAGDGGNLVDFYEGPALKATFSVGNVIAGLPAAYFGNPNTGENGAEPYVYLNFTSSDLASRFDRIVFRQGPGGGFETDNHSVFDVIIPPPGIPEPSTLWLVVTGVVAVFARRAGNPR